MDPVVTPGDDYRQATWIAINKPETLHFILKVTDKGTPALSRYQRIIVTITP